MRRDWAQKLIVSQPCIHGHPPVRYVSNGICVECMQLRVAAWRVKNPPVSRAQYSPEERRKVNAVNGRAGAYARWLRRPSA